MGSAVCGVGVVAMARSGGNRRFYHGLGGEVRRAIMLDLVSGLAWVFRWRLGVPMLFISCCLRASIRLSISNNGNDSTEMILVIRRHEDEVLYLAGE